jgi:hypothetical protein
LPELTLRILPPTLLTWIKQRHWTRVQGCEDIVHTNPPHCAPQHDAPVPTLSCDALCAESTSVDALNRGCFCVAIEPVELHEALATTMAAHGLSADVAGSHPNLFAALPVYLSAAHVATIARVVAAIESMVASPLYQASVLAWAPAIAQFDPHSPGGLLGFDFHLGVDGPRLIEINTNPGGVLLNALLAQAQRVCMPDRVRPVLPAAQAEEDVFGILREEWRLQRGDAPLRAVAIVDESPPAQYLFPEFLLYAELLRRHGVDAVICDPHELQREAGRITVSGRAIDMVYNRLTDFPLAQPGHDLLRAAYLDGDLVLSPHPRAHALYADKRNLALLGDRDFLIRAGCSADTAAGLAAAVPRTVLVTDDNRADLWGGRRDYFFKPAAGFGSKASYRGDKLTRRVWDEIAGGDYVAQKIVLPGLRHVTASDPPLKADIRCYAYRGRPVSFAARLYQGQTTNFRTPGGGFAPVLTVCGAE